MIFRAFLIRGVANGSARVRGPMTGFKANPEIQAIPICLIIWGLWGPLCHSGAGYCALVAKSNPFPRTFGDPNSLFLRLSLSNTRELRTTIADQPMVLVLFEVRLPIIHHGTAR